MSALWVQQGRKETPVSRGQLAPKALLGRPARLERLIPQKWNNSFNRE
jgi:hypothetical protein